MLNNNSLYDVLEYKDQYGNLQKQPRSNKPFIISGGKIDTGEVLVQLDHVYITGLNEIPFQQQLTSITQFKVDYTNGIVYLDSSLNGNTLNLSFYASGQKNVKAINTTLIDANNNFAIKNTEKALEDLANRISNLILNTANPAQVTDALVDGTNNTTYTNLKQRLDQNKTELLNLIGSLNTLTTSAKTSIVNAINELVSSVGVLASLNTTTKTSLTGAINEVLTSTITNLAHMNSEMINVKYPPSPLIGAKGDGTTDDTVAIQNIVTYACQNNYKMIFVPDGNYKITNTIITPQGTNQPIIIGANAQTSTFDYSTIANGLSCLKFKGGSGALCNSYISNITFKGNANSIGITFADVCGVKAINCKFATNHNGVMFLNESVGGFTEYCVAENCDFASECSIVVEYKIISGDMSFHGSGLSGHCTINQSNTETNPKILIGTNCLPYNSPLDFQCWTRNVNTPVISNQGDIRSNFYGQITIEPFHTTPIKIGDVSHNDISYVGGISTNNENIQLGNLILCDRIQANSDGSLNLQRKPYTSIVPVGNVTTNLAPIADNTTSLVDIRIYGAFYDYSYTLIVYKNANGDGGHVTTISTNREFNQAGYGSPIFNFNGSTLNITNGNYPTSGITAQLTVTQLGNRSQYFIQ